MNSICIKLPQVVIHQSHYCNGSSLTIKHLCLQMGCLLSITNVDCFKIFMSFLKQNDTIVKPNFHQGLQFLRWELIIQTCFLPFPATFPQFFLSKLLLLAILLSILQIHISQSKAKFRSIYSMFDCFEHNLALTCAKNEANKSKRAQETICFIVAIMVPIFVHSL